MQAQVVVIGAGIGGLTTAALLLKAGLDVLVLEAHVYPGGSAGTFFHKGYRFDAGATLAGGFAENGPHARVAQILGLDWPVRPVDPAWIVQVGDKRVTQWTDRQRWLTESRRAFPEAKGFWRQMAFLADRAWVVSARPFPWPPGSLREWSEVVTNLRPEMLLAAPFAFKTVSSLLPRHGSDVLRTFVDAQLLISAQTTSDCANALYGAAALDLPRRGVNDVSGGIGGLAKRLADWITTHGGRILYRQKAEYLQVEDRRVLAVRTAKDLEIRCQGVVANLTPWGLGALLNGNTPERLEREIKSRQPAWGAFTLYLGLDSRLTKDLPASHFQVVADPSRPLGEGNSVFISLSDPEDSSRAPAGRRAATLSTHTIARSWWLPEEEYALRREQYTARLLDAAEMIIPGIKRGLDLVLPGTPRSFEFFTRRPWGWVGGYPQTSLLTARGPWSGLKNAWLVGDSIFPGQSTAGVTLGAMRVSSAVLRAIGTRAYTAFDSGE